LFLLRSRSRLVDAKSSNYMLLVTTSALLPTTRVLRRLTTGRLIADLFRTIHKVKTKKVVRSRGHQCGDIELAGYLANAAGPAPGVVSLELNGTPQGARVMLRWHALGFEEVTIE
jgi:hypothetical protein